MCVHVGMSTSNNDMNLLRIFTTECLTNTILAPISSLEHPLSFEHLSEKLPFSEFERQGQVIYYLSITHI